jgi:hypothetical protein|tara:strand:- start:11093 stop:11386 length:294 start_codon:yes stop_codon:yes gene_type:complete
VSIPKSDTVISRIENKYGMPFIDFIEECRDEKEMDLDDICKLSNCSLSNIRRIFRQFKFNFHVPPKEKMISETEGFKSNQNTLDNLLYRKWIGRKAS